MEEEIHFTVDNTIAYLTLNRPHLHNAFNRTMLQKFTETLKKIHEMPSLRALVIRGNGESFCTGADISWMEQALQLAQMDNFLDARLISLTMNLLDTLPIPTISFVHGAVMGGGVGIVACSDIVLCDSKTTFGFLETKVGLIPAIISPFVLRAIGSRYARRYFFTGEKFGATQAQNIGLVHEIVDFKTADAEINKFIQHILTGGPHAIKRAKSLIQQVVGDINENTRMMNIELFATLQISEEGRQGIASFLEKTRPPWVPKGPKDA
jgi:methylglutaconyl-CoA hydratase